MAQTIVFLLSDKASYITGAQVVADGGYLINWIVVDAENLIVL